MQSVINKNIYRHKSSASKGFNNLCTIVHALGEEGLYDGHVYFNHYLAGSFQILYTKDHSESQVNIDASAYDAIYRNMRKTEHRDRFTVGMNGFVTMYASGHHTGVFITLTKRDKERQAVYDTRKPQPGDRIVFTAIYPGYYRLGSEHGEAEVTIEKKGDRYFHPSKLPVKTLSVSKQGFNERHVTIAPLQPLLVEIKEGTSLTFEMINEIREEGYKTNLINPVD